MTSLRTYHRELVCLLLVTFAVLIAAGLAHAATTTAPTTTGAAGVGRPSAP